MPEEDQDYSFDLWKYSKAEFYVRGYMLKQEPLWAWKNREHDGDEIGGGLCLLFC